MILLIREFQLKTHGVSIISFLTMCNIANTKKSIKNIKDGAILKLEMFVCPKSKLNVLPMLFQNHHEYICVGLDIDGKTVETVRLFFFFAL